MNALEVDDVLSGLDLLDMVRDLSVEGPFADVLRTPTN